MNNVFYLFKNTYNITGGSFYPKSPLGPTGKEYSQVYFVSYRNMPSIDDLMQEWPAMFEEMLKEVRQFSKLYFFT